MDQRYQFGFFHFLFAKNSNLSVLSSRIPDALASDPAPFLKNLYAHFKLEKKHGKFEIVQAYQKDLNPRFYN